MALVDFGSQQIDSANISDLIPTDDLNVTQLKLRTDPPTIVEVPFSYDDVHIMITQASRLR